MAAPVRFLPMARSPEEAHSEQSSKRQRFDAEEQKEESQTFPIELLSETIRSSIGETFSPAECAESIANMNPELLLQIVQYTKKDFLALFSREDKKSKFFADTLCILYTTALRNSRYYQSVCDLEENIESLMPLATQEAMRSLIEQAEALLNGIEATYQQRIALLAQIEKTLNLFAYIDFEADEQIKNLYIYARNMDNSFFINCRMNCPTFFNNLRICAHERESLQTLRRRLLAHAADPQKRPELIAPASQRNQILNYEAQNLYEAGVEFLTGCLKLTLRKRKQGERLPQDLVNAINQASKIEGFGHLNFNALRKRKMPILPAQFVWNVLVNYAGKDINEFMGLFIERLGNVEFDLLVEGLNRPNEDKKVIILDALTHCFPQATFPSLKIWVGPLEYTESDSRIGR